MTLMPNIVYFIVNLKSKLLRDRQVKYLEIDNCICRYSASGELLFDWFVCSVSFFRKFALNSSSVAGFGGLMHNQAAVPVTETLCRPERLRCGIG